MNGYGEITRTYHQGLMLNSNQGDRGRPHLYDEYTKDVYSCNSVIVQFLKYDSRNISKYYRHFLIF